MRAEDRGQLVRGKVVVSYWRMGSLSSDFKTFAEMDEAYNIVAVTPWFRHDDLESCNRALEMLKNCYWNMPGTDGSMMISFEYKDYKKI